MPFPDVIEVVYSLANLSLTTYQKRKVLFTAQDIPKVISVRLEETGFIVKNKGDRNAIEIYQFRHLVLQEYLSAVMLFIKGKMKEAFHD